MKNFKSRKLVAELMEELSGLLDKLGKKGQRKVRRRRRDLRGRNKKRSLPQLYARQFGVQNCTKKISF